MFQKVYPDTKQFPELQSYKGIVQDDIGMWYNGVDPYELWYYYINNYVMRYVNNYYGYEKYDPRIFKKNINKAIDNYWNTQQEKCVEMARAEVVSIQETIKKYKPKIFHNGKEGILVITYTWKTEDKDACKYCKKQDGKQFTSYKMVHQHWNCRCKIQQDTKIITDYGEILLDKQKIL